MRLILQRVTSAEVLVEGESIARIGNGVLVLVGVEQGDSVEVAESAAKKLAELRIFADSSGRMNLNAQASGADFLVVSQFTLAARLDKGRRPSFDRAAPPEVAKPVVDELIDALRRRGLRAESGRFGAHMAVSLVNDGPVTFVLDLAPRATVQ